jgi:hypothetical protein
VQWGIVFKILNHDEPMLTSFPEPSMHLRYQTMNGPSDFITVTYLFHYAPQSWKELQRVAGIKHQMCTLIPSISMMEEMVEITPDDDISIGTVYTVSELGKFFHGYIAFPKPWYPQESDDFMKKLAIYAKKLYYEELFHFESVLAMAIFFNQKIGSPYSRSEVLKKAISILALERGDWKKKQTGRKLHKSLVLGGKIRGQQLSAENRDRQREVLALLPKCRKANGKPDVPALVLRTGYSKSTIYSILKKIDT